MSKVTSGATTRFVGDIITSTIVVTNTGGTTGTTTFTDPIPPTPAGTTRNFSSAITLLASGNTPAGTGTITDSLVLPPGSTVTYIIDDTVTDIGTYQKPSKRACF
jgi:hypothetical protein